MDTREWENINFWYGNWLDDAPPFSNINPNMEYIINNKEKVCDFITSKKQWNSDNLKEILPEHITNKINTISIPITNVNDKSSIEMHHYGEYSVKTAIWTNNDIGLSS